MKKKVVVSVFAILASIIIGLQWMSLDKLHNQIDQLNETVAEQEAEIEWLNSNRITYKLNSCPICGGDAVMNQMYDKFYIRCESCRLHTDYFDSRSEVAKYWNGEE